jgi:flagellar motor switch protein FliG
MAEPGQNLTKAAVVINALTDKEKTEIFKLLEDSEIRRVMQAIAELRTMAVNEVRNILKEFYSLISEETDFLFHSDGDTKALILQSLGEERARNVLGQLNLGAASKTSLESLDVIDPRSLANFLINEHPQTIALIVAHLDPQKKSQVIKKLPESLQSEVILRIANMDYVAPELVTQLDRVLQKELATVGSVETQRLGGVEPIAEMFNIMDKNSEETILTKVEEKDPMLAEEIRKLMFTFDDMILIDDRGMQQILKEVQNEKLILALKASPEEVQEKILGNMSDRASTMIKEDLEAMGPVRMSDVEAAQQEIVNIAKRLEEEGKIMITRGGDEDTFV